jgi:hypothetical protein
LRKGSNIILDVKQAIKIIEDLKINKGKDA